MRQPLFDTCESDAECSQTHDLAKDWCQGKSSPNCYFSYFSSTLVALVLSLSWLVLRSYVLRILWQLWLRLWLTTAFTAQEALTAMNLCAASLRRAVQDMTKMRKALAKVRKQQEKAKTTAAAGQDAAASRALAGRTNFSKSLTAADPLIMRSIKTLLVKRPMKPIKEPEELVNGTSDSTLPFVMKKGRGLTKQLVKDVSIRGHLDATVQEFCKSIEQSRDAKSVFLGLYFKTWRLDHDLDFD